MTIKYVLYENRLPSGGEYRARVKYTAAVDLEGVLDQMTFRSSSITRADMLAVFEDFLLALLRLLLEGVRVITPFGEFGLTIKGDFTGTDDKFKARRNQIELVLKPGERLVDEFKRQARVRKVEGKVPYPNPRRCFHLSDPATVDHLTPGHLAQLTGHYLKFGLNDEQQGIFLVPITEDNISSAAGPEVRVSQMGHNTSRKLIFLVPPDLPPGAYRLEVRAVFGLDNLRTGRLEQILYVA